VKREIDRNGTEDRSKVGIKYSCFSADARSKERKVKANRKRKKLLKTHWLREFVHKKLANKNEAWAPDTLAKRLKDER
jgi:IS30 family transposase